MRATRESVAGSWKGVAWTEVAWAATLLAVFGAIVFWFNVVDFYHRHFFDSGIIVFADNVARIAFLLVLAWLIYAPGAALSAVLLCEAERTKISRVEQSVLGFGIGVGLWHVFMLILGYAGLFHRSVMIAIAAAVLMASCLQFGRIANTFFRALAPRLRFLLHGGWTAEGVGIAFMFACGAWLLVARGLYPGGGGDYYTHYFYYNLEVLKNHGLSPNDVWYHLYYSQGYGLHFLGMLLTDPEAPALATFCCIIFAAVAMAALTHRIAPRSFWPSCVACLYLLFHLVCVSARGGGEFQKGHEQMGALIVMATVGLSMARGTRSVAWVVMAASCGVAVASVAPSFGVIIGFFFMLVALWAILRRDWAAMWQFGFAGAAVGGSVAVVFGLSYWSTGLPNDQALNLMLRFADIERLDRWGVLPQIAIATWIRDNYVDGAAETNWWGALDNLRYFMRLDQLWVSITVAIVLMAIAHFKRRNTIDETTPVPTKVGVPTVIGMVGGLLTAVALISLFVGQTQSVSFERASSFLFPLSLLLSMAICIYATARLPAGWGRRSSRWLQPIVLLVGTLVLWANTADWPSRVTRMSENGLRFFFGRYSLAEAYSHIEDGGLPFGGINPQALAAAQQLPPDTRIWATNVDAYCMAPGCWIESVVSFKMSRFLDEILTASPERAKQLLTEAGINYFLVMENALLLDLLPYSQLFNPKVIGDYLGIKWTNGSAFLLTWIGPDTTPLTPEFLRIYRKKLDGPEHPWFRFSHLVPQLPAATASLRNKAWGDAVNFPWRAPPRDGTVNVVEATFGNNCRRHTPKPPALNHFRRGNATRAMRESCNGRTDCRFRIDYDKIPDPANGCEKDFSVAYRCRQSDPPTVIFVPATADYKTVSLSCLPGP